MFSAQHLNIKASIAGLAIACILATAGIFVQIYMDVELMQLHDSDAAKLQDLQDMFQSIFSILIVLLDELEPTYIYSDGPFEAYFEAAKESVQKTDTQLVYTDRWPVDFSILTTAQRVNLSSNAELRRALRAQRDRRRQIPGGISPKETLNVFTSIIDNFARLIRGQAWLKTPRFEGFRVFLSMYYSFQTIMDFRRFSLVGRPFVGKNRTNDVRDADFRELILFQERYIQYRDMFSIMSTTGWERVANLSFQDASKDLERIYSTISSFQTGSIELPEWERVTKRYLDDLEWTYGNLAGIYLDYLGKAIVLWETHEIVSPALFAVASFIMILTIGVHAIAFSRLHRNIKQSYKMLDDLTKLSFAIYDHLPEVPRIHEVSMEKFEIETKHVGLCFVSLFQVDKLTETLGHERFCEMIDEFHHIVENAFHNYKHCTKISLFCGEFAAASGLSLDQHNHVTYLLYFALNLLEDFHNAFSEWDEKLSLVIGLDSDEAVVTAVHLKIPQTLILGQIMNRTSLLQALSLPGKIHVSYEAYSETRQRSSDIDFAERFLSEKQKETIFKNPSWAKRYNTTFWAQWADESSPLVDYDGLSIASQLIN